MKRVAIINGPNLNLLGKREPEIYGGESFEDYFKSLKQVFSAVEISYDQHNVEGELVNLIQARGFDSDYIILNAAAYTHTSVAIADAVAAVPAEVIGVHISNIYQREVERHVDLLAGYCKACLFGFGLEGYRLALQFVMSEIDSN
ncbi:MAG: 3-dehydroquinate dehydratase [Bacteroidia bacterium]|nr:3-dehydroquinate dehydratase [Bacteroidia bacterium]